MSRPRVDPVQNHTAVRKQREGHDEGKIAENAKKVEEQEQDPLDPGPNAA